MSLDITRLTRELRLNVAEPGTKHHRTGWVNIPCPFCSGGEGYHLGYNIDEGHWNCYRCGWHNQVEVIQTVAGVSWAEAKNIVERYGGRPIIQKLEEEKHRPLSVDLPKGTTPMAIPHKRYLKKRGFNHRVLAEEWGLLGTGPIGPYKFRIIAPIFYEERLVSYQGRDITGRSPIKYKACPLDLEAIPHKEILYGLDKATGHTIIVVEGVTDVWRLGPGAVATFGIEWTKEQASLIKKFPRRFIAYDPGEPEAVVQSNKLAWHLAGFSGTTGLVEDLRTDPGDLSDEEARELMVSLFGGL